MSAVSYTHLDVYKRQGGDDAQPACGFSAEDGLGQQKDTCGDGKRNHRTEKLTHGQAEENGFLVLAYLFGNFYFDNGSPRIFFRKI